MSTESGMAAVRERRRAERQELIDLARAWSGEIAGRLRLERAVVFGSVARGDFNRWSDVDLLVVSPDFEGSPLRRLERLGDRPARVQPVCWRPEEWVIERERGNPIAREAEAVGIPVGGMNDRVREDLAEIGGRGDKKSRRHLDPETARSMVRIREARRAYREFHARCFWSCPPDLEIGVEDVEWVGRTLMKHGDHRAWEIGSRLCR